MADARATTVGTDALAAPRVGTAERVAERRQRRLPWGTLVVHGALLACVAVIAFPFIAGLFAIYMWLALRQGSVAQRPERLFRSRRLLAATGLAVLAVVVATFVDLPWLSSLSQPYLIKVG